MRAKHGKVEAAPVLLKISTDKHVVYAEYSLTAHPGRGTDTLSFNMDLEPGSYTASICTDGGVVEKTFSIVCGSGKMVSSQGEGPDSCAFPDNAAAPRKNLN